ncbi:UNKNOWN [Stylonychia lemnae]|uniref:Centrosomal protein of 19 kDa n=1 Tax=Stylonychia lemnae TaxID=5949 RepID=A0A078A3Z2_STYLE|nr:UNKNOWN [Stylonychia lemnae]|eukprot:CDW76243.1 UNKNOWN [Stylonychia lemnae]
MSTFLTQGSYSSGQNTAKSKQTPQNDQQLQSSLLYAPFVKPTDKIRKDVAELSFSDFQPKRFALSYNPPVIVLEYLVPSTGKLYHHKMKLRQLNHESEPQDMLDYLKKRHPLYFMPNKLNHKQIEDLIKKLIFKVKQQYQATAGKDKLTDKTSNVVNKTETKQSSSSLTALDKAPTLKPQTSSSIAQQNLPSIGGGGSTSAFKSGSSLPSISNDDKKGTTNLYGNKQKEDQKKFEDDFGDDFEDDFEDEEEDGDGDFDANELLNLTDYQNKRKQSQQMSSNTNTNKYNPTVGKDGAIEISNDDDEFEDDGDAWGDDWGEPKQKKIDFDKFDYQNTNLNKLSTEQIAAHKKKMDEKFNKNLLKPGDSGFVYDKRIEFTKGPTKKVDTSWDEGEDDVDEYFDDDFM